MAVDVKLFDDLDAVAADAGDLLDRARQPCLFDRLDWFRLVQAHGPGCRVCVLRATDAGGSAWLFLAREGRTARPLANWYTLRWGIVTSDAPGRDVQHRLLEGLRRSAPRLARLDLHPIDHAGGLAPLLGRHGWHVSLAETSRRWRVDIDRGFEQYWAQRPGALRSTFRRKSKAARLDTTILDRFDRGAWSAYERVYAGSWKGAEGSPAFLRALAEQEGAAGTLRLGLAFKNGEPVAAQMWLVENGVATIHKLAYTEAARPMSPGTILSEAMFRHVIDIDRVRVVDFGLGDDDYKADWMERSEPVFSVTALDLRHPAGWSAGMAALVRRIRKL